jgi:hypothetical protein
MAASERNNATAVLQVSPQNYAEVLVRAGGPPSHARSSAPPVPGQRCSDRRQSRLLAADQHRQQCAVVRSHARGGL